MVKNRFKRIMARSIVTLGTILAGIGIWVSILNSSQPSATLADNSYGPSASTTVTGLGVNDGLLTDSTPPAPAVVQTTVPPVAAKPAPTTPATTTAAPKPAATTAPATKVTAPAPRLRTRGS